MVKKARPKRKKAGRGAAGQEILVFESQTKSVLTERRAGLKEGKVWKARVRQLVNFPNIGVPEWRPVLEQMQNCRIHHTDKLYQDCDNFVRNFRRRWKEKLSKTLRQPPADPKRRETVAVQQVLEQALKVAAFPDADSVLQKDDSYVMPPQVSDGGSDS